MKYIGLAMLALAAVLLTGAYRRALGIRVSALEDFVRLICHVRTRVCEQIEPPREWAACYSEAGEYTKGMLELIMTGQPPSSAFRSVACGLPLSIDAREALDDFFSSLGRSGIDRERQGIEHAAARIGEILERERDERDERGRLAAVMALMLSAGGAILII